MQDNTRGWLTYDGGDSGLAIAVRFDRYTFDRPMFQYLIAEHNGPVLVAGDDLGLGTSDDVDLMAALRSLVTFMGAAAESYDYAQRRGVELHDTECGTLFPVEAMDAISAAADYLTCDLMDSADV